MLFRDVGVLVKVEYEKSSGFAQRKELSRTEVFLNKKSIRQSEFYAASATGIQLEATFEVRSIDFSGHTEVEHSGKRYKIVRVYDRGEISELSCSNTIGG